MPVSRPIAASMSAGVTSSHAVTSVGEVDGEAQAARASATPASAKAARVGRRGISGYSWKARVLADGAYEARAHGPTDGCRTPVYVKRPSRVGALRSARC